MCNLVIIHWRRLNYRCNVLTITHSFKTYCTDIMRDIVVKLTLLLLVMLASLCSCLQECPLHAIATPQKIDEDHRGRNMLEDNDKFYKSEPGLVDSKFKVSSKVDRSLRTFTITLKNNNSITIL